MLPSPPSLPPCHSRITAITATAVNPVTMATAVTDTAAVTVTPAVVRCTKCGDPSRNLLCNNCKPCYTPCRGCGKSQRYPHVRDDCRYFPQCMHCRGYHDPNKAGESNTCPWENIVAKSAEEIAKWYQQQQQLRGIMPMQLQWDAAGYPRHEE